MSTADIARSFVIHLGMDAGQLGRLQDDERSHGMSVIGLDFEGIPDRSALIDYLATAFMFPHKIGGLDAAVDLISDLEWFGNPRGYLVTVRGLLTAATNGLVLDLDGQVVDSRVLGGELARGSRPMTWAEC